MGKKQSQSNSQSGHGGSTGGTNAEKKVKLKTLNEHIICGLCKGYLINSTTITECLHTFCRSCIVTHLKEDNTCPTCEILIHQSHPLNYISHDRTMQDLIYKIVPNLQRKEIDAEMHFYEKRNLPLPKHLLNADKDDNGDPQDKPVPNAGLNCNFHRKDEQLIVCLECDCHKLQELPKKFLCLSAQATITHLKKYISFKVFKTLTRFREIDIFCNGELLGKDHTLKFVQLTRWRCHPNSPLELQYKPHVDY